MTYFLSVLIPLTVAMAVILYITTFSRELWYKFKFYIMRYKFEGQRRIKYKLDKANESN